MAATVEGDDGPDRLRGTPEADVMQAFGGDDRVLAFGGDDRVLLGAGDDRAFMGAGNDEAAGGSDDDRLCGGGGNDSANGEAGRDRLGDATIGLALVVRGLADPATTRTTADSTATGSSAAPATTPRSAAPATTGWAADRATTGRTADPATTGCSPTSGGTMTKGGAGDDDLWALLQADVDGPAEIAGDVVRGGDGDDRIRVSDGELDVIGCGPGFDVAILDFADLIEGAAPLGGNGDCERVRRAPARRGDERREGDPLRRGRVHSAGAG